jgi:NAD-dependent deacetylase
LFISEIYSMSDQALLPLLRRTRHLLVLTGAGMSAESGIPTFRDALTGLWARFCAEDLATPAAFRRDRELVWGWYEWRRMQVLQAKPNAGHLALARLAAQLPRLTIVTQNVDDLHERAGSPEVLHLHGSLQRPRCQACAREHRLPPGIPQEPEGGRRLAPPRCGHCGGWVRPGVVWFGESLPAEVWKRTERALQACDLMLVIGTSGLVQPAAGLPLLGKRRGLPLVQLNPHPSELDGLADVNLRRPASYLAELVGQIGTA